jgi:hypothetical protein
MDISKIVESFNGHEMLNAPVLPIILLTKSCDHDQSSPDATTSDVILTLIFF